MSRFTAYGRFLAVLALVCLLPAGGAFVYHLYRERPVPPSEDHAVTGVVKLTGPPMEPELQLR